MRVQTGPWHYYKGVYTHNTMGMARSLKIISGASFFSCVTAVGLANALDVFEVELRTLDEPSQESIDNIQTEFIDMLCLPFCATTFLSPDTLSAVKSSILAAKEGVPSDMVEMLTRNMYCNLCPPWPLCPQALSQCLDQYSISPKNTTSI